jgi:hypothetical protein
MVIRNRYYAFIYRLILLGFGFYTFTLLMLSRNYEGNYAYSLLYFETQVTLVALAVVIAEVIANAVGLNKGAQGMAPGVWSPLYLGTLFFLLADSLAYWGSAPIFYGAFIRDSDVQSVIVSKLVFPLLFLTDYLLFGEKGTVKWKHAVYWLLYPFFYFWILLATNYLWNYDWFAYPYFNIQNFASSSLPGLKAFGGWGGVWISATFIFLGMIFLAYVVIFFNFLWAGAFKKQKDNVY